MQPRQPIDDREAEVHEWVSDVDSIVEEAKLWAEARGWPTKIDSKAISEETAGHGEMVAEPFS